MKRRDQAEVMMRRVEFYRRNLADELASIMVRYTEKPAVAWNSETHRLVGKYEIIRSLMNETRLEIIKP